MLSRITENVVLLFPLLDFTLSAMVLPRPPSSPNHIRHDYVVTDSKSYVEKAPLSFFRNTIAEKPDIIDVKLLEVRVEDLTDTKPVNWHDVMEEILERNESYPSPEVVPHSMFGVRNVDGLPARFQLDASIIDKKMPNVQSFDEKLYYLKRRKNPKVYVNVRGHSGNFAGMATNKFRTTTGITRQTGLMRPFREDKKLYVRKIPKKFNPFNASGNGEVFATVNIDSDDDGLTTENPHVITSSELPKQIPAPPSKIPVRFPTANTTPVFRHLVQRTDILPSLSEMPAFFGS